MRFSLGQRVHSFLYLACWNTRYNGIDQLAVVACDRGKLNRECVATIVGHRHQAIAFFCVLIAEDGQGLFVH